MRCVSKILPKSLLSLSLLLVGSLSQASVVSISEPTQGASFLPSVSASSLGPNEVSKDVFIPATPNGSSVSYNRLSNLVVDKPLTIINTRGIAGRETTAPPELIILETSNLNLASSIEIVGETADLLIINTGSLPTTCSNCSFGNAGRVTLATASVDYLANYQPDKLTPTATTLRVGNLTTENVAALELISRNLIVEGAINTQARGYATGDGGYAYSPSGNLIIGSGGVNAFIGLQLKYNNLANLQVLPGASFQFGPSAAIYSQAVRINSGAPVNLAGIISTRSDVATIAIYRDKPTSNEEAIRVVSLDASPLQVTGSLQSDYLVDLRGIGGLTISGGIQSGGLIAVAEQAKSLFIASTANINLPGASARWPVVATGGGSTMDDLRGYASCAQNNAAPGSVELCLSGYFVGGSIENNGIVRGRTVVFSAINALQNRYGGKIFGDFIHLSSDASFVRNGSAYPFKTASDPHVTFSPINPEAPPVGTVSINGIPFLNALNGASKNELTAWVIGKHIQVVAAGNVENINPYVVYTKDPSKWNENIALSPEKISQVLMIADNNLKIGSKTYILNASAQMGVNNSSGALLLNAPQVANQRYSTHAVIDTFKQTTTDSTLSGQGASLMVYSPPGVIYSFSPGTFNLGGAGSFVNNTSYFEMLSDAIFTNVQEGKILNIGLNLTKNVASQITPALSNCLVMVENKYRNVVVRKENAEQIGRDRASEEAVCRASYSPMQKMEGKDILQQRETLFAVRGRFGAENSDLKVTNHDYNNHIKSQAISEYIAEWNRNQVAAPGSTYIPSGNWTGSIFYNSIKSLSLSETGDAFVIQDKSLGISSHNLTCIASGCDPNGNANNMAGAGKVMSTTAIEKEGFLAILQTKYAQFKATLIAAIEKLAALIGW